MAFVSPGIREAVDHHQAPSARFRTFISGSAHVQHRIARRFTADLEVHCVVADFHPKRDGQISCAVFPRIGDQFGDNQFRVDRFPIIRRDLADVPTPLSGRSGIAG